MLYKMCYKIITISLTIKPWFRQRYNILQKHHISNCRPTTHSITTDFFLSFSFSLSIHLSPVPWYWWGRPLLGLKLSHNGEPRRTLRSWPFCSKLAGGSFPSKCEPETPALLAGLAIKLLEYGNETDFTRSSLYENALWGRSIDTDRFCNTLDRVFAPFRFRSLINFCSPLLWLPLKRCGE